MQNVYSAGDVDDMWAAFVFTACYSRHNINLYLQSNVSMKIWCHALIMTVGQRKNFWKPEG